MIKKLLTICILFASLNADVTLKTYLEKDFFNDYKFRHYLYGVGIAYTWSNHFTKKNTGYETFCVPSKLALGKENYMDILNNYILANNFDGKHSVEMLLHYALKETFPCSTK